MPPYSPRTARHPAPAPDESDFLESDLEHDGSLLQPELTDMEIELAAAATPVASQATTTPTRRAKILPSVPIFQMTYNFSFTYFDAPAPSADLLNQNFGRSAAGLPLHAQRNSSGEPASEIAPHLSEESTIHWFSVDAELVYLSFFDDWGPLNVAMFYRFCLHLHHLINSAQDDSTASTDGVKDLHLILYTSSEPRTKANAALLAAMYAMICGDATPADAFAPLSSLELLPFRDAGYGRADFYLTIQDVLYGVHRAISERLLDLMTFDLEEYETYEQVQNGDWNWITPNIIAFASPNDKEYVAELRDRTLNSGRATPGLRRPINSTFAKTIQYFKRHGVKLVVRLNNPLYDSRVFEKEGIEHIDMYFDDGSNPCEEIVRSFIARADEVISSGGVVAIHCKAGLGRTGVLIGAYLAYKHGFSAGESIGFMRIMRPGCVVGPQQHFMYKEVPNWIRWREQDDAQRNLDEALSKQRQELMGKRPLSVSNDDAQSDGSTDQEVDISIGESEGRQFKKLKKSAQAPSTPKRNEYHPVDEASPQDHRMNLVKPTPCVGQPRKSPSPSRKRTMQANAPSTVARMGSRSLSFARSRVVSTDSARSGESSSSIIDREKVSNTYKNEKSFEHELNPTGNRTSNVLMESTRVVNAQTGGILRGDVGISVAPSTVHLEPQDDYFKSVVQPHDPPATQNDIDDGLFVQGWKSPEPPSAYIERMTQSPGRTAAPSTPTSPSTPTHGVVRASPHIREKFGLRDAASSNHNTPRSRKEASEVRDDGSSILPHDTFSSTSNGSLANCENEKDKVNSIPSVAARSTRRDISPSVASVTSTNLPTTNATNSRTVSSDSTSSSNRMIKSRAVSRVPSSRMRTTQDTNSSAQRSGGTSAYADSTTVVRKPNVPSRVAATSNRSGSSGRVAAARDRLAQSSQPTAPSRELRERSSLKRLRANTHQSHTDRGNIRSTSGSREGATGIRSALGPASSVTTNSGTGHRPVGSVAAHQNGISGVPRFAMSTAASTAKSVSTKSGSMASTSGVSSRSNLGNTNIYHHGNSGMHGYPATKASTSFGRLNGRNVHRRRSSLGETDIVM